MADKTRSTSKSSPGNHVQDAIETAGLEESSSVSNIAPGGKKVNRDAVGSKNQGVKNAAAVNAVLSELKNAEGYTDEDVAARLQEELVKKQLLSELEQKHKEKRLRETLDEAQRRQLKR